MSEQDQPQTWTQPQGDDTAEAIKADPGQTDPQSPFGTDALTQGERQDGLLGQTDAQQERTAEQAPVDPADEAERRARVLRGEDR